VQLANQVLAPGRICRRYCSWIAILLALAGGIQASRPNVLFLFTDDQRYDTIAALGNPEIRTPHLDRLLHRGVSFSNAYIMGGTSPAVCSPSRASLFSGRTLWHLDNQGMWGFEISPKYRTLPQVFRESGYATFATGKNEPGQRGHFARSFNAGDKILFRGMTRSQYQLPLFPYSPEGNYSGKRAVMHKGTHSAEIYADACIAFLEQQADKDQPFFAYVAFQTPHDPRQAPKEIRDSYLDADLTLPPSFKPEHPFDNGMLKIRDENLAGFPRKPEEVRRHLADYYATITHTDAQIGRVLESLAKTGKAQSTIVVFTSDNGLAVGRHGLMGKQNLYEHSVRVPLIIAGPDLPVGESRDQLCYIYDLYPTLCERAGLKTPNTVEFRSLNPTLTDKTIPHRETLYFAFMDWQRAIRDQRYKLIEYCVAGTRHTQLFDLDNDEHELQNLAAKPEHDTTLKALRANLQTTRVRLNDGNSQFPFTNAQGKAFWSMYEQVKAVNIP
jgi:arylsulfatase A-like enzyme